MIVVLCSLVLVASPAFGQDNPDVELSVDWQDMTPERSRTDLKNYGRFIEEYFKWDIEDQKAYLFKGRDAALSLQNDTVVFHYTQRLGHLYLSIDSQFVSLTHFNTALELAYSDEKKVGIYNMLGFTFSSLEDYNTALEYYFQALDLSEAKKSPNLTYIMTNISDAYTDLKDYQNALKYIRRASQLAQNLSFPEKEYLNTFSYTNMAKHFVELNQLDSAQYYIEKSLENVAKIDTIKQNRYNQAANYGSVNAIAIYTKLGMSSTAKSFVDKIRTLKLTYTKTLAKIFEAQYEISIRAYSKALSILNNIDYDSQHFRDKEKINQLKIDCYKALGNSSEVMAVYEKQLRLKEDKIADDISRNAILADVKYETFKKNEEIKTLKLDKQVNNLTIQNQRYLFVLSVVLIGVLIGVLFFIYQQAQRRKAQSDYLEEQVALKTQDLHQANEELKVLNYIASHDIKEPMRNIGNYVGLIKRKLPDELKPQLGLYIGTIEKSIQQLYTLIEDMATYLTMSKDEKVELSELDTKQLFNSLSTSLNTYVQERNGQIIYKGQGDLKTSRIFIYVILKNLIENGLKFNQSEQPTVEVHFDDTNEKFYRFLVRDNGIGIEESYFEKIFKSFKRLHNRNEYKGSGIGLAIVQLLTKKLNGSIHVTSELGNGSTFELLLSK